MNLIVLHNQLVPIIEKGILSRYLKSVDLGEGISSSYVLTKSHAFRELIFSLKQATENTEEFHKW